MCVSEYFIALQFFLTFRYASVRYFIPHGWETMGIGRFVHLEYTWVPPREVWFTQTRGPSAVLGPGGPLRDKSALSNIQRFWWHTTHVYISCVIWAVYRQLRQKSTTVTLISSCVFIASSSVSQRDRATLCVVEYFAKSLKVIRNDTTLQYAPSKLCLYLVAFLRYSALNNGMIRSRSLIMIVENGAVR